MIVHNYKALHYKPFEGYVEGSFIGFNKLPVFVLFILFVSSLAVIAGQSARWEQGIANGTAAQKSFDAKEKEHANNYKLWNEYKEKSEATKKSLTEQNAELISKYENLQCSTRGLVVTTVKGITLCMNPETKALHKIDEVKDSK